MKSDFQPPPISIVSSQCGGTLPDGIRRQTTSELPVRWNIQSKPWGQAPAYRANPLSAARGARQ